MLRFARQVQLTSENQKALPEFEASIINALKYLKIFQHSCIHQPYINQINIYVAKIIVSQHFKFHSFTHSANHYLLSICYVTGMVLNLGNMVELSSPLKNL